MRPYLAIAFGFILLVAPLWTLSGFVTVPEHRTGGFEDYRLALFSGLTLYGGVLLGVLVGERFRDRWVVPAFRRTFLAGIAGAMAAITFALTVVFLEELITTGRLMPRGQSPALLPIFYIVGGILSAFMAAGAGLVAFGLRSSKR